MSKPILMKKGRFTANASGHKQGFNNIVNTVVTQSNGQILIGGSFTNFGAVTGRNCLIRINESDETVDAAFCANASDGKFVGTISVTCITLQSDGKMLIGGVFTDYGGVVGRNNVLRLNSDGTLDEAFVNNASDGGKFNDQINSITLQTDGKILISGAFLDYGGVVGRSRVVRLNSDGTLDTTFCANAVDGTKFATNVTLVLQSDGKIMAYGSFSIYNGVANRRGLIRLNSDGTLDTTFCTNAVDGGKFSASVSKVIVQSDSKILVGGTFTNYGGTTGRSYLVRLNSDGTLDTTFCTNAVDGTKFNSAISQILNFTSYLVGTKILIGGGFTNYGGTSGRSYLVALNADGTLYTTFNTNAVDGGKFSGSITAFSYAYGFINPTQHGEQLLISGNFLNYGGITGRNKVVSLNCDGTLNTTFCTNAVDGNKFTTQPSEFIVSPDEVYAGYCYIYMRGGTTNYAGTGISYLNRVSWSGTNPSRFYANAASNSKFTTYVNKPILQPDGKLLIFSGNTNYKAPGRDYLIRLNIDGTLDTAFCANASDNSKFGVAFTTSQGGVLQSDGKIIVYGNFTNYGGTTNRNRLIRLNSDGTLDTAFCVNASDSGKWPTSLTVPPIVQSDGKILIGGGFTNYGGTTGRSYLVRLNSDGTLDTTFCTNAVDGGKFNGILNVMAIQPDGKILVGGNFTNYGGTAGRSRFIRLNSDGTLDTTFCANAADGTKFPSSVSFLAVSPDGSKIFPGFSGVNYGGVSGRDRLVCLNSDGTLNTQFCANAIDGSKINNSIYDCLFQSDGKILVNGAFTNYGGTSGRSYLIRLNSDGSIDTQFCDNATDGSKFKNTIGGLEIQPNGNLVIVGAFTNYDNVSTRNYVVRLSSNGTFLDSPVVRAATVTRVTVTGDHEYYVAGVTNENYNIGITKYDVKGNII